MYLNYFSSKKLLVTLLFPVLLFSTLAMSQEIHLYGQVYTTTDNSFEPVQNALINIHEIDTFTHSDSSGFYEISFLWNWNGPITVICSAEGFENASQTIFPDSFDYQLDFSLTQVPLDETTFLSGFIFESGCDNCPVANVVVSAYNINSPSDEVYSTESNLYGHYYLELPLNPDYGFIFSVNVYHPEFQEQTIELEIGPDGQGHDFFLALSDPDPELGVYGHVYGPTADGMILPLAGAEINVWSQDIDDLVWNTETDESGYYELPLTPGNYILVCQKAGYEPFNTGFWVGNVPVNLSITLEPQTDGGNIVFSGTVNGAVSQWLPAYEPLAGALIQVFPENDQTQYVETITGEDGDFTFFLQDSLDGFPLYQESLVRVSSDGFITQEIWIDFNEWPQYMDFYLELQTQDEIFLSGNIFTNSQDDPNQVIPVTGALIQIFGGFSGGLLSETVSDTAGFYQFGEIVTAAYQITVSAEGYYSQEHPLPGYGGEYPMEMDFSLEPVTNPQETGWAVGMVTVQFSEEGPTIPVEGAEISASPAWGGGGNEWYETSTGDNGMYSLELPVINAPWTIHCVTQWGDQFQSVFIPPGEEVEASFHFDTWNNNDLPAPFDLTAELTTDPDGQTAVYLHWEYPPIPDPGFDPVFVIYSGILSPIGIDWVPVGESGNQEFLYIVDENIFPSDELCFQVRAIALGQQSAPSNDACVLLVDPVCFDLSGIDFGDCEMILGIGWNGEECVSISGCGFEVDGVDYSSYFFGSFEECQSVCNDLTMNSIVFGTVTGQFSPMGPVFPVNGALIQISSPWDGEPWYESMTNEMGEYEIEVEPLGNNLVWTVSCISEFGTQQQVITAESGAEIQVDFHFNVWEEPIPSPPYDLIAEYDQSQGDWGAVYLYWQQDSFPDPDQFLTFNIYVNILSSNGEEWSLIANSSDTEFIYYPENSYFPEEGLCFMVTTLAGNLESEPSNFACVFLPQEDCMDLSGVDFGPCDMDLGAGWNGSECSWFSGCGWEVNGIDYSPYFFNSIEECEVACNNYPPPETAVLYGTVNYLWENAVEVIAGAEISAINEMGMVYETMSGEDGSYELNMVSGVYSVTCVLPETGDAQTESVYIDAGDMVNLDFWFGEPVQEFALTGMVYGVNAAGDIQPLDGAQIVVHYGESTFVAFTSAGSYWLGLPEAGEYQVEVNADGYIGTETTAYVEGIAEYNFFLDPLDGYMLLVELSVGVANALPGDTVMISLFANIPHPVSGIQFTMTDNPEMATAVDYHSELDCFTAEFNDINGSAITIFYSLDGCVLEEGSYEFATLTYVLDPDVSIGDMIELWPEDVTISDPNGLPMEFMVSGGFISVGLPGDINFDAEVNVLDIVSLVGFILLTDAPTDDEFSAGDFNGDGILNVLDVVQIVNLITGNNNVQNLATDGSATVSVNCKTVIIQGKNIAGFQLTTDRNINIYHAELPPDWNLQYNQNRLIAYSMGEPMTGDIIIEFDDEVSLSSILISDTAGSEVPVDLLTIPESSHLYVNYPNPFNPQTTIRFDLDQPVHVTLTVYNILGEEVAVLVNNMLSPGYHEVNWNPSVQSAEPASNIYFVKLIAGRDTFVQKILFMK